MENNATMCPPMIQEIIEFMKRWGFWCGMVIEYKETGYISYMKDGLEKVVGMQDVYVFPLDNVITEKDREEYELLAMAPYLRIYGGAWALHGLLRWGNCDEKLREILPEALREAEASVVGEFIFKELADIVLRYGYKLTWDGIEFAGYKLPCEF